MSTASISYSSLKDASSEAKAVAKKLDKYADSLYDNVYKKLNKYDGSWTSNLTNARSKTNAKISELRSEQSKYESYATDLIDLRDECKEVDKAVKSRVSSLTASYKESHGIKNRKVENAISYFFTGLGNETAFGRWLGDKGDQFEAGTDYLKSSIKEWYNYEGGKELIKGVLVAVLEIAIAVVGILTGGTLLAIIAACIALAAGVVNLINEVIAYNQTNNLNDPARGRRTSEINSVQDWLRTSDNKTLHTIAGGIDLVNLICGISAVISGVGSLLKNGYKWATGSVDDLAKIEWKNVFSKNTFKQFGTKFVNQFKDLKLGLKFGGWDFAKKLLLDFGSDFMNNLKTYFTGNGLKSVKASLGLTKDIIKDGITIKVVFENIIAPSVSTGQITTLDNGEIGQIKFDFDSIKVKDFYDIFDDTKSKVIESDFWSSGDGDISKSVLNKLSEITDINITIPEIHVPEINMPVLRAA